MDINLDKVKDVLLKIDKSLYIFLLDIYDDVSLLNNFYIDTYYTKEMILDKIVKDIRDDRKKFDKLRVKLIKDCIKYVSKKGIENIKDDFTNNLKELGISPVSAYVYSIISNNNIDAYHNIYIESLKELDRISSSNKRYHGEISEIYNNSVSMYLNSISYMKNLENTNKILKQELEEMIDLIVQYEDEVVILEEEIKDIVTPKIKTSKKLLIGGYKKKNSDIEQILVEDIYRYKDKIKNADYIIFDTKRNSHSAFNFVKKLNKNIELI